MIAKLSKNGVPLAVLNDDGSWSPAEPDAQPVADYLNVYYDPRRRDQPGDHHAGFGRVAASEAAAALGATLEAVDPLPPLPEDAVS